jgi:hypothetical protein
MTIGDLGFLSGAAFLLLACGGDKEPPEALATNLAGGETSEFGGDIPACPCGTLRNPLRATVTAVAEQSVRIRVDEFLGAVSGVELGGEIEGVWDGALPCYVGRADVRAGDEVLAFVWPAQPCVTSPGVECPLGATTRTRIALTPWGNTVMLADATRDLIVPVADLSLLEAPDAECRSGLGNISEFIGPADSTP